VPQSANPPHIWWCPTGPLTFLPIHAAGAYGQSTSGVNVSDFVCSSYTPTLTAIIETHPSCMLKSNFQGLLAVSQPNTPGQLALPNTATELIHIQKCAHNSGVQGIKTLEGPAATMESVIKGMAAHGWVHLACHAAQDAANPTQSAFYLHDGPLELSMLVTKSFQHAELAFLSACQTVAGHERLSEEAVHLAAGMLLAGYRGVIATMWSIMDKDAPVIAEKVYSHLFSGGEPDRKQAAYALHHAVQHLRKQVGDDQFLSWVPFVHMGI
jgi:CHAT domain-containing protein